ncbi:MAG: MgtC/SapB family protein [Blastocatellales bacterium]|nr:MgtC/SapB family protein [Blastocatellales bacterium]
MGLGETFFHLVIALGLGLLVGLQREHAAARLGGIRTFPLVTLFGSLTALLAGAFGGWIIAAGLLSLTVVILIGRIGEVSGGSAEPGLTTEIAMLMMFGVGAFLFAGSREIAVALGSGVAILLHFKGTLHSIAARFGENDLKAIMQFALISLIILPVLPDRTYLPFDVINPRHIWLMVVLIVGINVSGFIAWKFFGEKTGVLLGGVLGGLISSTATTVSYARRAAGAPSIAHVSAVIILAASMILYLRVTVEVATVAPHFLPQAAPPLLLLALVLFVSALVLWFRNRGGSTSIPEPDNPSELRSAVLFALFYGLVLLAVAAVEHRFGNRGLLFVAALSGLTDVDAISLSISQMVRLDRISGSQGWRLIVIATLSNLLFKGGVVAVLGNRELVRRIAAPFITVFAVGLVLVLAWP